MHLRLTPLQRQALEIIDAQGWIDYYAQDINFLCGDSELTPSEAREQQALAAAAKIGDSLDIPDGAMCAADILDHLIMFAEDHLFCTPSGDRCLGARRAAGALAKKLAESKEPTCPT